VADHAARVEARLGVVAGMKKLPPRQRATLVCRHYQGLDVEETAAALGCSIGTVKSQLVGTPRWQCRHWLAAGGLGLHLLIDVGVLRSSGGAPSVPRQRSWPSGS